MKHIAKSAVLVTLCAAQIAWGADPLDNWASGTATSVAGVNLNSVTFGKGQFIANGAVYDTNGNFTGAVLLSSPDGVTWTQRKTSTAPMGIGPVVFGNGLFVASVGMSTILSFDGVNWTDGGALSNAGPSKAYGNGQFVAAGGYYGLHGGTISSSSDGINWITRVSSATASNLPSFFYAVAYGNGRFVAVGTDGIIDSTAISSDGVTWTNYPNAGGPGTMVGTSQGTMIFGNGLFMAVGGCCFDRLNQSRSMIAVSSDGLNWATTANYIGIVPGGLSAFTSAAYGGGQFVVGGNVRDPANITQSAIFTSSDATNWVAHDLTTSPSSLTFGNGQFVGLLGGGTVARSGVIGKMGASLSPGGGVQGTITGVTGQGYAIKASTNLAAWDVLTNVTINTNGLAQFSDSSTASFRQRFYQALLAQP